MFQAHTRLVPRCIHPVLTFPEAIALMPTYLIIGASRGIGLEFTSQLLARDDPATFVYATARNPATAHLLSAVREKYPGKSEVLKCDVAEEASCKVSL